MNITIKNEYLTVVISTYGAEIQNIIYGENEYMHDGNKAYWSRRAPLLFPHIGCMKDNFTIINNEKYPLSKHGFIRDEEFTIKSSTPTSVTFENSASEKTKKLFPFDYNFEVTYKLNGNTIESEIEVGNKSNETMPFNLGLHPAFHLPITEDYKFEDYRIHFSKKGTYNLPIVNLENGTIDFMHRYRTFTNMDTIELNHEDYCQDALIFENINCHEVTLTDKDYNHGVKFEFNDFPMLGIWSPYPVKAPFVCLEPWIGCADTPNTNHEFEEKRDILYCEPDKTVQITYKLTIF